MRVLLSIHRPDEFITHSPPYPQASVAIPPATRETEGNRTQHTCVLVPFLLFLLAIASYPGGLRQNVPLAFYFHLTKWAS